MPEGTLQPGDVIAGYRLLARLGEGGMGVVWRAEHLTLGRAAAVKVIRADLARDPDFRRRFGEEARAAAALDHPNVVTVFDGGEADGHLYLAMALVEGGTLRERLDRQGPLPARTAVAILAQVGAGLDAAHRAGLVHRDVKPANVLVSADLQRAWITDFGVVKAQHAASLTRTGAVVGTLDYLAPEQAEGGRVDARTDVYGLGCLLYETLTGQVPYARDTPAARLGAHLHEPPPRPSEHAGVPAAFDAVVARAMAKAPDQRYASTGELAQDAARALDAPGAPAPPPAAVAAAPSTLVAAPTMLDPQAAAPPPAPPPPPPPAGGGANRTVLIIVAAILVLALGAGVAVALTSGGGSSGSSRPAASGSSGATSDPRTESSTPKTSTTTETQTQTETVTTSTTTDTTPSGPDDWPGGSGYTAQLASMRQLAGAESKQAQAQDAGLEAGILRSDDYPGLSPGYWVVFSGQFDSRSAAQERVSEARSAGFSDAFPRYISP